MSCTSTRIRLHIFSFEAREKNNCHHAWKRVDSCLQGTETQEGRTNSLESPEPLIVQLGSDFANSEEIYPKEEVKLYWHLKDDKVGWV